MQVRLNHKVDEFVRFARNSSTYGSLDLLFGICPKLCNVLLVKFLSFIFSFRSNFRLYDIKENIKLNHKQN